MKISWPPCEENEWMIESIKFKNSKYFFQNFPKPKDLLLLAYRIKSEQAPNLELISEHSLKYKLESTVNTWNYFPWPIEQHTLGIIWSHLETDQENLEIELGFYPFSLRQYYMRGLLNEEDEMVRGYRYNKNGQLMNFIPYKTEIMTLPEDTYIIPRTNQMKEKGIHLLGAKSKIQIKKE